VSRRAACTYRRQIETVFAGGKGDLAEPAFTLLVERHGPMVLRVCRSVLRDPHDAEDALQATFLVLVHRARTIRKRESLGPWLHGVALRIAACARTGAARRRAHERRWAERQETASGRGPDPDHAEVRHAIHDEIGRLPDRYRAPIVLCDLESRPLDEAARQLGWPLGTVKSRLNRGRQRLRDRLLRRGLAPALAGPAISAEAAIPEELLEQTVLGALATTAGATARSAALARTILLLGKGKGAAMGALTLGLVAVGIGILGGRSQIDPRARASANDPPSPARGQADAPAPKSAEPKAKPVARRSRPGDDMRRVPVTLTGQAKDEAGKPIAGAAIYVTNANRSRPANEPDLIATARTGPDGRFELKDLPLPVLKPEPGPLPAAEEGRFQVAGTAQGFGFTWHPVRGFRPGPRPATGGKADADGDTAFYEGEPIRIDLVFGAPAVLRGRVRDDQGKPLSGVPVQVGYCDDTRRPGGHGTWQCLRVDPTDGTIPYEKRAFNGIGSIPEAMRATRTGADGSFRIEGLPRETQFLTLIDPGPEYEPFGETIATTRTKVEGVRTLGDDMMLEHTFQAPVETRFRVKRAWTDQPAPGVTIRAKSDRTMLRSGGVGVTDEEGRATLRLRPGEYAFSAEPASGSLDLPAQGSIRVAKGLVTVLSDVILPRGAAVVVKAFDAKTGAGIEGVGFAYETDTDRRRRELRSQAVVIDHPVTDERGQLRAVLPPGRYRFVLPKVPPGWRLWRDPRSPAEPPAGLDFLDMAAGREYEVRFTLERSQEAESGTASGGALSAFPQKVQDQWKRQRELLRTGKYRIRRYDFPCESMPLADLVAFLDATDLGEVADPAAVVQARFPNVPAPGAVTREIVESGRLRRNTARSGPGQRVADITVYNGAETIRYDGSNAQVNIIDSTSGVGFEVLGTDSFNFLPRVPDPAPTRSAKTTDHAAPVRMGPKGGRTVEVDTEYVKQRWVVDGATGFVCALSTSGKRPGLVEQSYHQYGPKHFSNGAILPKVHVEMVGQGGAVDTLWLTVVEHVDPSYRPGPRDFVVAAPAGTLIIDGREDYSHPKMGTCHYPVADVLVYAEGMSSRNRSIEPVVKTGQPAPPLQPVAWLDRNGPITPPELKGKVVLIDFWGITCGPCVGQLPEVQAAVDHFAGKTKDLVVIGLHESGFAVEKVAEFARKRGLNFALAIDRPETEEGWFGASFKAYGVHAIPSAAVIDRQGRVAFVGRFTEALQKAADLLETQ
jgi:RNA polymerase sigma factor (sigma-70 family)